jgi:ribulose-5-phosphate 4-epimerase/fuculose-1-phosphate aldolase
MTDLERELRNLVVANRILAHENIVDSLGHVSIRNPEGPDRFFMSRMRSPEFVTLEDIMEFRLDCEPIDQQGRAVYNERFIHGAIYKARADVMAVVHNHSADVLPFTVTKTKLRPLFHIAATIGSEVPVWDIHDRFGDTDLLVKTLDQGQDLAQCLGRGSTVLMRGHGVTVAEPTLYEAVRTALALRTNAKLQTEAMRMGEVTYLTEGEIIEASKMAKVAKNADRAWEYWSRRAGADKLSR